MLFTNLDTIVRRQLLELGLPIHFYAERLFYCASAVRELSFDSLKIINSARLPVGDYGQVDLPEDFADDVACCIPVGGAIYNIPKQNWLNPIRIHSSSTGEFVKYSNSADDDSDTFFGYPGIWNWYWNINDFGEPTGRFFGANGGSTIGYTLVKQRRQLQFTDNFIGSNVVLLYISDGQQADNASNIETVATAAIQAYSNWKASPNAAIKDSPEAATYYNERRLLRARLNDLTRTDILNIIRDGYKASIKS